MLILHILLASATIINSFVVVFRPARKTIAANYLLLSLSVVSGFLMTLSSGYSFGRLCVSGLFLVSFVIIATRIGSGKLSLVIQNNDIDGISH